MPATTPDDVAEAARLLGVDDAAPVAAEPFGQWVIEDRFAGPRPPWDMAGAQWARDVGVYETMKLRLLNGSHSAIAYLGFLLGHTTVWQAADDALVARYVERMMADPRAQAKMQAFCMMKARALPRRTRHCFCARWRTCSTTPKSTVAGRRPCASSNAPVASPSK